MFLIAMILGILFPSYASFSKHLVIPALAFVMTLSLGDFEIKSFEFRKVAFNLFLNYVFLGGIILFLSSFLTDEDLKLGFVVMAAAPPAVAIVPFSRLLGGDVTESAFSSGIIYVSSLFLTPVIILGFTGKSVDVTEILRVLVILILIPLVVSRFFHIRNSAPWINIGFGIVIYTVIGLNIDIISRSFFVLLEIFLIGVARTFGTGSLAFFAFKDKGYSFAITKALFPLTRISDLPQEFPLFYLGKEHLFQLQSVSSSRSFFSTTITSSRKNFHKHKSLCPRGIHDFNK